MNFVLIFALIAAIGWIVATVILRIKEMERATDRLERRLGLLLDHFGIVEPEPAGMDGVRALAAEGRTVEAIKAYREATGAGLVEAKQAVEAL
ncbi:MULTISPECIES: hypothetical protein [unclassified Streptomyces]|uniref:hypothetical protein n=1 Tax=unclassified Streptomyces TaxID=2593676 RepID=UPI00202F31A7|nr:MULTISPECIES: hypothetical protein [unclassified Streptomyces]MCM1971921.1 hypothetical protein [Streptomyces sp. G1]MCX5123513.1 hypothetical protein [Streptomyces sp. NBC_00347]MCX5296880.1 hypothetical protein [Streptomyces sp. NBC_00193]